MIKKFVYCHFSYRRPKGKDYGIFSVAIYGDKDAKRLVAVKVRAFKLWDESQHITGIQAYEHALYCIWELQGKLLEHGVTNVVLVNNNYALCSWIENIYKNKKYTPYLLRATQQYKSGSVKEIKLAVGLADENIKEKAHKYCTEELVINKSILRDSSIKGHNKNAINRIDLKESYRSINDIIKDESIDGLDSLGDEVNL